MSTVILWILFNPEKFTWRISMIGESLDKIREISLEISLMEVQEFANGCRRRLLIMDSQIDNLRLLEQAYREVLAEVNKTLAQLQALYQINCKVLNIVNAPEKAGEEKWQGSESNSSQSRMLKQFAKSTH